MNLLVIDDDVLARDGYALLLPEDNVRAVRHAADALPALKAGGIDGVITDLVGTGGTAAVKVLRAQFPAVPVAVLTGLEDAPSLAGDPLVRVLIKGHAGPLEARAALAEMRG